MEKLYGLKNQLHSNVNLPAVSLSLQLDRKEHWKSPAATFTAVPLGIKYQSVDRNPMVLPTTHICGRSSTGKLCSDNLRESKRKWYGKRQQSFLKVHYNSLKKIHLNA